MQDINYERDMKIDKKNLRKELEYKETEIFYKYTEHYKEQLEIKEKAKAALDVAKQKDELDYIYAKLQLEILSNQDKYKFKISNKEIINSLIITNERYRDKLIEYRENVRLAKEKYIEATTNEILAGEMLKKMFQRTEKVKQLLNMELKGF